MSHSRWRVYALFGSAALLGLLVGGWVIRPVSAGAVGFDSAASVIHFDRIVSGQGLEAFVTATPKPLLTVLYGVVHSIVPDWRVISWLAIIGLAVSLGLAAVLADRLAGPTAAGFATLGILGSAPLFIDVARSYAVVWALIGCLVAGLALSGTRRHYTIAGLALLCASLARFEILVLVPIVVVLLVGDRLASRDGRSPLPAGAWWLLLPIAAVPIMLTHDQLLTGNPWFWVTVSQRFSDAHPDAIATPIQLGRSMISRYRDQAAISLLAIIGILVMLRERRWSVALGVLGLSVGVAAFLLLLGARGTYVSSRYLTSIDLALIFAAAIGVGRLRVPSLARARFGRGGPTLSFVMSALVGATVAVALSAPFGPLDGSTRSVIRNERRSAEHADAALVTIDRELNAIPASRKRPNDADFGDDLDSTASGSPSLLVPVLLRPRLSIDLDIPLTNIGGLTKLHPLPDADLLHPDQVIFHDKLGDAPRDGYAAFELDQPADFGRRRLDPVLSDVANGWWVLVTQ